ncbi:SDR family NAD(P)-dependent oxidoreductase [Streptomyces sp. NPDC055681]
MSQMRFDDRVAIVTGAGNGLGRAYAVALAGRGAKVLVNDLSGDIHGRGADNSVAQQVVEEIRGAGGTAEANGASVADPVAARGIVEQALDTWGRVDIVINNAGSVVSRGPIDQNEDEHYLTDLRVAAGGSFFVTKAAWPHMWERDYGRILNVSSSAFLGMRSSAGYPAAKGATWGLTRNVAHLAKSAGKDIRVNCVMPTAAARMTPLMGEPIASGMAKFYPPESAAHAAAFLVHEEVPVSGEMFVIGGDQMRRVFVGISTGVQAELGQLSMEGIRESFDQVMDVSEHVIATRTMDKLVGDARVDWAAGVGTVF